MTPTRVPLGILDLVPVSSGSDPRRPCATPRSRQGWPSRLGYRRYWFAEHHLNSGVAGSAPALLIAMAGAATEHIRLGSGGVQSGHRTALSVVEEFGLLDAMYPARIDLGIGRSGGRNLLQRRLERSEEQGTATSGRPHEGSLHRQWVAHSRRTLAAPLAARAQHHADCTDAPTGGCRIGRLRRPDRGHPGPPGGYLPVERRARPAPGPR